MVINFPRHTLVCRDVKCDCDKRADDFYCVFCETGLALCVVCGGAEASMPTHCPGKMMTDLQAEAVQAGVADYSVVRGWRCT